MRRDIRLIIPYCLVILLLVSACEVNRPASDPTDISGLQQVQVTGEPTGSITATVAPTVATDSAEIEQPGVPAPVAPPAEAVDPDRLLIKLAPQAADQALQTELSGQAVGTITGNPGLDNALQQIGVTDVEPLTREVAQATNGQTEIVTAQAEEAGKLYAITLPPNTDPQMALQTVSQVPEVEYAEQNFLAGITAEPAFKPTAFDPNDPYYQYQWNMKAIQMPIAWNNSSGEGVIVAVIDTGIDFSAPDFANTPRLPGYDFINNDNDPTDDQGHGTHVAGTIAQSTNNGVGVAGVAFNAQLLPIKALDENGQGSYENIIKGIVYAVDQGAKVINLSLAGRNGSQALQEAVKYAYDNGVLVVAAAGNSASDVEYPANYDEYVLSVGAISLDNSRAPYSNFGPAIDLVAPGGNINADLNSDGFGDGIIQQTFRSDGQGYSYRFFEGTSMAAPHVAGVAALLLAVKGDATPTELEAAMTQTAFALGSPEEFGAGIVQAANAVQALAGLPTPIAEGPTPTATRVITATVTPVETLIPGPSPTLTKVPDAPTTTPTSTPTPIPNVTPTPTLPPPPPGSNLLTNGDFETTEGWIFGDTPVKAAYDTSVVQSGSQAIRLGNPDDVNRFSYTSIWQPVTIPAEAQQAQLTVNIYPISQNCCGGSQQILILNDRFQVLKKLSRERSNSQQWETRNYDVTEFRGQTVHVYIGVFNTGQRGQNTALYVDNVSLTWQ